MGSTRTLGAFAGITLEVAFGWVVGVAGGFSVNCGLVALGMRAVVSESRQAFAPQRRFPERKVP
jgi:hypothetical protein